MALTPEEIDALIRVDPDFARLVQIYGRPTRIKDCTIDGNPGDICMVGNCVNGKRLVLKCDDTFGCTIREEIPC